MKKIALLTSGGDAPGMNAAIRAVVRYAIYSGMTVYGVEKGFAGLINNDMHEMGLRSVSNIIQAGGTILRTARCDEFKTIEGQKKAVENLRAQGIEGLIVLGGDGSFMGARALSNLGFPTVGIPATIDNDLAFTDYALGFDTACNTVLDAINKIRDTMNSHERVSIVEVMGRHCGDLALYSGIGGGAEVIVVPEMPLDVDAIVQRLSDSRKSGKLSGIVVLAEGAGKADDLCKQIGTKSNFSVRFTVLGHIQRGGSPSMTDRKLGTLFGVHAVKLLEQNLGNRIVGIKENKIFNIDIIEGLKLKKQFNIDLFEIANIVAR